MFNLSARPEILANPPAAEGRPDWPEGSIYRYDRGGHELLRVVRKPGAKLAAAVADQPVELALLVDGPLVVLCSKVGEALPWDGAAFHWHRVPNSERILPPTAAATNVGARVDLILMEADRGRVRAVRPLTLPLQFSKSLHEAILDQARYTYDPGAERRAMEALLRRCPTPTALVGYASIKATITT